MCACCYTYNVMVIIMVYLLITTKMCFFISDSSMKREKFCINYQINHSYHGEGGLTCSFTDLQLSEFIQQKRQREGNLPVKKQTCR